MDDARTKELLDRALELAEASVAAGGGPFGALVVRAGAVIAEGENRVALEHDPTAHAEVVALRAACRALGTHELSGCTLITSCEPCPMCWGAAQWSRVEAVVFAADRDAAARAGFDDRRFHAELGLPPGARSPRGVRLERPRALAPFEAWAAKPDRVPY